MLNLPIWVRPGVQIPADPFSMSALRIKEIIAKSILVPSKLPDCDYVVNPYTGCEFACKYCYASFMGRYVSEPIEQWGSYCYVKINAVELFREELAKMRKRGQAPSMLLSSVTDPYQGQEAKYQLTRGILGVLAEEPYPGEVSFLTKSPMVLRDVDLLMKLPHVEVGMTVTSTDDAVSRFLEVSAPSATSRIHTLLELNKKGIKTYAFIGPLLPHFRYDPAGLEKIFSALKQAGVKEVYIEHINLSSYILKRLGEVLKDASEETRQVYEKAALEEHRKILNEMVIGLIKKYGLKLRMEKVLYHNEEKK